MSFAGSSDVLPWNHNDGDLTLDGAQVDIQTVQVHCINTRKFSSNKLAANDNLPQPVHIIDVDTLTIDDPILIDPVRLNGAVGSNDIYPLGEGKLHILATIPCGYIAIHCFICLIFLLP